MNASDRFHRRDILRSAAAVSASLALPARAQADFPRGPLKLLIALPAGGAADVGARAMAAVMERSLKQSIVVENRPGGNFQIAMQALLTAPADGHTFMHVYNGFSSVHVVQKLYDMERQMAPVAMVATTPIVLLVKGDSPHKSLRDLVAFGRANPGKLNYSTLGPGGVEHLKMAQFEKAAGFKGVPVPYRGGPDALKALLGGEIDFNVTAGIFAKQFAPSGQVRVLAVMEPTRWKDFPDVPTFAEAGVPITPMTYWGGFVMRAGTPPEIVQRMHREMVAAATDPSVVERIATIGQLPAPSKSPEEFRQHIAAEIAWMTEAAKGLDLKN